MDIGQTDALVAERYDARTILLHWLTAALVVLTWIMGQIIDDFPRGPPRVDARSVHILLGVAVSVALVLRIANRAGPGRSLPRVGALPMHLAAQAVHYALYAMLIAQAMLGFTFTYIRGDSIFGLFALPGYADKELRGWVGYLHGNIANAILIVAGFHAAAALAHHYLLRDNVLRRMLPTGSRTPARLRE